MDFHSNQANPMTDDIFDEEEERCWCCLGEGQLWDEKNQEYQPCGICKGKGWLPIEPD